MASGRIPDASLLWNTSQGVDKAGGESGIRTHVRVSPKHAFQACAFSHSAISPAQGWDTLIIQVSVGSHPESHNVLLHIRNPVHGRGKSPNDPITRLLNYEISLLFPSRNPSTPFYVQRPPVGRRPGVSTTALMLPDFCSAEMLVSPLEQPSTGCARFLVLNSCE